MAYIREYTPPPLNPPPPVEKNNRCLPVTLVNEWFSIKILKKSKILKSKCL